MLSLLLFTLLAGPALAGPFAEPGSLTGELRKWHKLEITFRHDAVQGEWFAENPFRSHRLQVTFVHLTSGATVEVPGFFATDGRAADSSANAGRCWRVRFAPDRAGTWSYVASFRTGPDVSLDPDPAAGRPTSFDGASGTFFVQPADPRAPGFLSKGRLAWDGMHHLLFLETRERFLKGGAGSPENLLGYHEFDRTFDTGGVSHDLDTGGAGDGLHHFDAHAGDAREDDASWLGGGGERRGSHLTGALNYLASAGANSAYFLTYNIDGGDGREVWPWSSENVRDRFDVSKLAQWERVFEHMTRRGLALNVITQEQENDQGLDNGLLGPERRLYYRELVARFAHHPALFWNLGEENTNTPAQREAFATAIRGLDAYDHPITAHSFPNQFDTVYTPLLGFGAFEGPSMQLHVDEVHEATKTWIDLSAAAGRPWFCANDEQVPSSHGVVPDADDPEHDAIRKQALWGNLMAQGSGCEWYFGYQYPHSDLDCEDWRSRDAMWEQTATALAFFRRELPFEQMRHADELTPDPADYVLSKDGFVTAVYRPDGGGVTLDLGPLAAPYTVEWFDVVAGGALQRGTLGSVTGPGPAWLGQPPAGGDDWVAVVRRSTPLPPTLDELRLEPEPFRGSSDLLIRAFASDPVGHHDIVSVELEVVTPDGIGLGPFPLDHDGGPSWSRLVRDVPALRPGSWTWIATAVDRTGGESQRTETVTVP